MSSLLYVGEKNSKIFMACRSSWVINISLDRRPKFLHSAYSSFHFLSAPTQFSSIRPGFDSVTYCRIHAVFSFLGPITPDAQFGEQFAAAYHRPSACPPAVVSLGPPHPSSSTSHRRANLCLRWFNDLSWSFLRRTRCMGRNCIGGCGLRCGLLAKPCLCSYLYAWFHLDVILV